MCIRDRIISLKILKLVENEGRGKSDKVELRKENYICVEIISVLYK